MESIDRSLGIFYTWWRGDAIPILSPLPEFTIAETLNDDTTIDSELLDPGEISRLRSEGNRLYVARPGDEPVAWGWNATVTISIGELGIDRLLPIRNRYLWGFVTRPHWRGQGIYPHLLQAILRQDTDAERFWIGHEDGNTASARGILKAGFTPVGEVFQFTDGGRRLMPSGPLDRALACEGVFGVPVMPASDK